MILFVLTVALIAAAMALMAVGLLRGKRLRGSCGGTGGSCDCADTTSCPRFKALRRAE